MLPSATNSLTFHPIDTQEQMSSCFALRAALYGQFYRNIPAENFSDEFDLAVSSDGERISHLLGVSRRDRLVGTCRLVHAVNPTANQHFSEVREIYDLEWEHLARISDIPVQDLSVGELGKFSVVEEANSREIKWMLLSGSGAHALSCGIQIVIAIMPPVVERAARRAGAFFMPLEGVCLRRDSIERKRYLLRYHDYFLPMFRKLGLEIDTNNLERTAPIVLDMLLSGAEDGPKLWWIRSEDLANSKLPLAN